jgi:hypothetical protein
VSAWNSQSKKKAADAGRAFAKEIIKLAADIKLVGDGKLMIAQTTFREWRVKLKTITGDRKNELAEDLLVLAGRFFRQVGAQATEVIAQLMVLAADLTGASIDNNEPVPVAAAPAPKASAPAAKKKAASPPAKKPAPAKKAAPVARKGR